jgi:hypothetical protein
MDWSKVLKTTGEIAKIVGDLLDDGKVNGSNNNNKKN